MKMTLNRGSQVAVLCLLAALPALLVTLSLPPVAGVLLALLAVFVGPGLLAYLACTTFPAGPQRAVIVALSIGIVIFLGLMLHYLGIGITATSSGWSLTVLDLVLLGLWLRRAGGAPLEVARPTGNQLSTIAICGVLIATAAAISISSEQRLAAATPFTELSVREVGAGQAELMVVNRENEETGYVVKVSKNDERARTIRFTLDPGEIWADRFELGDAQVQARLWLAGAQEGAPYRWVGLVGGAA